MALNQRSVASASNQRPFAAASNQRPAARPVPAGQGNVPIPDDPRTATELILGSMREMANEVGAIRGNRLEGLEFFDSDKEESFDSHFLLQKPEELKIMHDRVQDEKGFEEKLVRIFFLFSLLSLINLYLFIYF